MLDYVGEANYVLLRIYATQKTPKYSVSHSYKDFIMKQDKPTTRRNPLIINDAGHTIDRIEIMRQNEQANKGTSKFK